MNRGNQVSPHGRADTELAAGVVRRPYQTPALTRYGTLTELTRGKGNLQQEGATTIP